MRSTIESRVVAAVVCAGLACVLANACGTPRAQETVRQPPVTKVDVPAALHRFDSLFGTTGNLPTGEGEAQVLAFVRDRMKQDVFYDTIARSMFRSIYDPFRVGFFATLIAWKDEHGPYYFRFGPCPPAERVLVNPWWKSNGEQVAICRDDYRPGANKRPYGEVIVHCEGATPLNTPGLAGCGCGDRLINCAPPEIAQKLHDATYDEPTRTIQHIVQTRRPFSDVMTTNETARSSWGDYFYSRSHFFMTGNFEFSKDPSTTPTFRPRPKEFSGGLLTMPSVRTLDGARGAMAASMNDLLCVPWDSQSVKATEVVKLSGKLRESSLFELTSRTGCQNCHARLENAVRAFDGWVTGVWGSRYDQTAAYQGTVGFYVKDHRDLRATGPATPDWFGRTWAAQPEFSSCIVQRVERFIYGGHPVPHAVHSRLVERFREGLDFADLVEQAVLAWVTDPQPASVAPPLSGEGAPSHAMAETHRLVAQHCVVCHTDGADIPSFEAATLDRRTLLRIGLAVSAGRMPPTTARPLQPAERQHLLESVCAAFGRESCRSIFRLHAHQPTRTAHELLRVIASITGREISQDSAVRRMLMDYNSNEPQALPWHDPTSESLRILLGVEQCGEPGPAMEKCISRVLRRETLVVPPPQGGRAR